MIISIGYRVKSTRGVQFRRWATNVLRQYLMQGYACQQKRLQDLSTTIRVMKRVENKLDSAQILEVVQQYTRSLDLLDDYDHQRLQKPQGATPTPTQLAAPPRATGCHPLRREFRVPFRDGSSLAQSVSSGNNNKT